MEDHGTVFKSRWKLLRERIGAMKKLWTKTPRAITANRKLRSGMVMAEATAETPSTDFDGQSQSTPDAASDPFL
jgi:hypothetical protein